MEIDYSTNKLKRQMSSAGAMKAAFGNNAVTVSRRLDEIEASPNLAILCQLPAANCHPLKGTRNGEWAVNISKNYRLIFELDHSPIPTTEDNSIDRELVTKIRILGIEDYH